MTRLALLLVLAATVSAAEYFDQGLRYVNNEVITQGDVTTRNRMRYAEHLRRGLVVPKTPDEYLTFSRQSLEDLTDEVLLAQEAKTLGIKSDREGLVREVLDASRKAGTVFTLRDQTEQRRLMERAQLVENVLGYYDSKWPQPSPISLERQYQDRRAEFTRPPRARVLQIVIQPTLPEARQGMRTAKNALLRQAQAAGGAAETAAKPRLDEFLAASPADQEAVLDRLVADLAALSPPADDSRGAELVKEARRIATAMTSLRSPEEARRQLEVIRLDLAGHYGKDLEAAFRDAARRHSQGANAEQGGQLGWIEPKTYSKTFDEAVFNLPPGRMSEVFATGQSSCLVLVAERTETRALSFDEVSGELDLRERRKRRAEVRTKLVQILRLQAMIKDVGRLDGTPEAGSGRK
jgi:parvulin-like peptidyl-prolyl isomerase